jgi:two-component system, cell cycle sensor histidine kinase and response regulator CckA
MCGIEGVWPMRTTLLNRMRRGRRNPSPNPAPSDQTHVVPCDRHRALVVDDERAIVWIFQQRLEHDLPDVHVDSAGNGQAAVEEFRRGHHAVLVMDLSMPIMNGREAFEEIARICKDRGWEMPAVIFCTGFAPPDVRDLILKGHPENTLLTKPVSTAQVVKAVEESLAHRLS